MSQEAGVLPSHLLRLEDPYECYQVDECVMEWGFYVRNELNKIEHKKPKVQEGRRKARLKELLSDTETVKKFASPIATR